MMLAQGVALQRAGRLLCRNIVKCDGVDGCVRAKHSGTVAYKYKGVIVHIVIRLLSARPSCVVLRLQIVSSNLLVGQCQ